MKTKPNQTNASTKSLHTTVYFFRLQLLAAKSVSLYNHGTHHRHHPQKNLFEQKRIRIGPHQAAQVCSHLFCSAHLAAHVPARHRVVVRRVYPRARGVNPRHVPGVVQHPILPCRATPCHDVMPSHQQKDPERKQTGVHSEEHSTAETRETKALVVT